MRPQLFPRQADSAETLWAIDRALELAEARNPPESAIPAIGPAWVGEEALGVALYCALSSSDFSTALKMAVNHDGDSDTTGSLVGQLMGAMHGEEALPARWLDKLELRDTIQTVAADLSAFHQWQVAEYDTSDVSQKIWDRYPGW